jgi:hypothetical protein
VKKLILIFLISQIYFSSQAQVLTPEDSLYAGLIAGNSQNVFSGYGEANFSHDFKLQNNEATLRRWVLFVGHKFNNKISLFTEMELENGLVAGKEEGISGGGTIAMEQAFIKMNLNPRNYFVAGLFIPRIGIINENHLPTTFNGVERPMVEQLVLPSTWRGLGIGYYGNIKSLNGLNYSLSLTNGMNSEKFSSGSGIKEGRQQGSNTNGRAMSFNSSLLYYYKNFRIQYSNLTSGSTALEKRIADSLQLNSNIFSNPILINECNIQYRNEGLELKTLFCTINIPKANEINKAFANNTPEQLWGCYGEISYDIFYKKSNTSKRSLQVFSRVEYMNLNSKVPKNGIGNDALKKTYFISGLTYKPIRGVSLKMDYTHLTTGNQNEQLIITPFPQLLPYYTSRGFLNLGVAFNF